ncbi:MAG: 3-hydroxyacyl-CoA dehydrogenase [Gammaproteobacteria bacterium]|nr:3-hydroxyacyl-CoA dehydrogenase [Gammaproteobacteria bacterium]
MDIQKAAVIGAGVMGASIAAHITNAGIQVYLLDIVPKEGDNRNAIAEGAVKKLLDADPAPFMDSRNAKLITTGNIEDHLDYLKDTDWVIEAVVENLQIKQSLYQKLDAACKPDCLISSNTSTLPLALLTQGMPDSFTRRFMITHFFNPPRYMRLLELIGSDKTNPALINAINEFADIKLGKNCVTCKDTPGFIGNRIGIYWLLYGLLDAIELGITVEQADAVIQPFGIPKTGIFGLLDLVGLDLIPPVLKGMKLALPPQDAFHEVNRLPDIVAKMIADGYTGRKGKGGFYRLKKAEGKRIKESINLVTGEYALSTKPDINELHEAQKAGLKALLSHPHPVAQYAWRVLSHTLCYAASLVPEISGDITGIDAAMRDGYNWKFGPFELLDQIGLPWFVEKLNSENRPVPPLLLNKESLYSTVQGRLSYATINGEYRPIKRPDGVLLLSDIKQQSKTILHNPSASLWDIGDGVVCLEFHSKMNTLDMDSMALMNASVDKVNADFKALIIHNDADNFSAGANLGLLMKAIHNKDWSAVEHLITQGQQTYQRLKYAPFPVVGAPSGLALGGGCEVLLHCDAIQAHAELYMGLVEVGVGLIPGWGGCKEYLRHCMAIKRPGGPIPPVVKAFQTIGTASVSKSAINAKELLYLSPNDGITMNKQRLLADAKAKALTLSENYQAPTSTTYSLPGLTAKVLLEMGIKAFRLLDKATAYDVVVGGQLAHVLSGGDTDFLAPLTENELLKLELDAFVELVKQPGTLARLEHMLKTGKPLRN